MIPIYHPVHAVHDGIFNTASGTKIDINNPRPEMFTIEDIASGLSNICRFGGQIHEFYSVAQHSMVVCDMAPRSLKLIALMHDAAEAYLGDIIKPLKVILGSAYTDIEERFTQAIFTQFNLDASKLPLIKPFDKLALEIEHELLQKSNAEPWRERCLDEGLRNISTHHSAYTFLNYYQYYLNPRNQ